MSFPNAKTIEAIEELDADKAEHFKSTNKLFESWKDINMNIKVVIQRFAYLPNGTYGNIQIMEDEKAVSSSWYTVERPWKNNMPFESCIPEGIYKGMPHFTSVKKGSFALVNHKLNVYNDQSDIPDNVDGRYKCLLGDVANHPMELAGCIGLGKAHSWFAVGDIEDPYLCVTASYDAKIEFDNILSLNKVVDVVIEKWEDSWK